MSDAFWIITVILVVAGSIALCKKGPGCPKGSNDEPW